MIKTYHFEDIYSKFSLMNSLKTFLTIILLISLSFAQSARDMEAENPASDNWQEIIDHLKEGNQELTSIPMLQ